MKNLRTKETKWRLIAQNNAFYENFDSRWFLISWILQFLYKYFISWVFIFVFKLNRLLFQMVFRLKWLKFQIFSNIRKEFSSVVIQREKIFHFSVKDWEKSFKLFNAFSKFQKTLKRVRNSFEDFPIALNGLKMC